MAETPYRPCSHDEIKWGRKKELIGGKEITVCGRCREEISRAPTPQEFYEANATNICNVPRVGHPEDPSGWAGVRRASEARFVAGDCLVMTLADAFDFAEKYKGACRK